jgi:hypothetical protein
MGTIGFLIDDFLCLVLGVLKKWLRKNFRGQNRT